MKLTTLVAALPLLCGCDYSVSNRQAVVTANHSAEVMQWGFEYITRDTNGAIWIYQTSKGEVSGSTKIFDAPK